MPKRDAIDEMVDWQLTQHRPAEVRVCEGCSHVWTPKAPFLHNHQCPKCEVPA